MEQRRTPKQEQEEARTEVTEVAPGVLRMQLPVSMPGLGHVNCYALVDDRGAAIVDPGLPGPLSFRALQHRLKAAHIPMRKVHTVIITHSHPDHFGGVAALAKESGAEVVTHSAFRSWWRPHTHDDAADDAVVHDVHPADLPAPMAPGMSRSPWGGGTPWAGSRAPRGAGRRDMKPPLRRRLQYRMMRSRMANRYGAPEVTQRVKSGDTMKLAGREWFAVHTPGHTLDHLCLHDPTEGVLLSGDHVLPTITPHISGTNSGRDPLGLFKESLDKVAALEGVRLVLPAHGHPFTDLVGRVESIKDHHEGRLQMLVAAADDIDGRRGTVEEFSHHLFRQERWGSMAESETYAHLEHLRLAGEAERTEDGDGLVLYEVASRGKPRDTSTSAD